MASKRTLALTLPFASTPYPPRTELAADHTAELEETRGCNAEWAGVSHCICCYFKAGLWFLRDAVLKVGAKGNQKETNDSLGCPI